MIWGIPAVNTELMHNEMVKAGGKPGEIIYWGKPQGPMAVETRAPRNTYVLNAGERCEVPPKTAHHVHGLVWGYPCQALLHVIFSYGRGVF